MNFYSASPTSSASDDDVPAPVSPLPPANDPSVSIVTQPMEIDPKNIEPSSPTTAPANPLKRKTPPASDELTPDQARVVIDVDADADADGEADGEGEGDDEGELNGEERSFTPASGEGEYESGRVTCEVCGISVSFRDEATGGFTLKEWNDHRETCIAPTDGAPPSVAQSPPSPLLSMSAHQPTKRRRAKRTEDERKAYLGSDPYVERFEAYRVLCKSCDKWIRLRPNSTYCSIPWDAHRKSCLAKKINNKNVYALEERNALFSKDPDVRKFDAERVLCNICDNWFPLNPDNHLHAVQTWLQHRAACQAANPNAVGSRSPSTTSPKLEAVAKPSSASPDPSSTTLKTEPTAILALPPPGPSSPSQPPQSPTTSTTPAAIGSTRALSPPFHDLNPANYAPAHESRRRNAEQRAATLRADKLIAEVEPNRVFCSLCQKWVQLRQDSSYCAYPWLQHRGKCLARHQRRAAKAAEVAEAKARKLGHLRQAQPHSQPHRDHLIHSHPPHSHSHPAHPHPHALLHPPRSHHASHPRGPPIQTLSDHDLESEDDELNGEREGAYRPHRRDTDRDRTHEMDLIRERDGNHARERYHAALPGHRPREERERERDREKRSYSHHGPNGHPSNGNGHSGHYRHPGATNGNPRGARSWNADMPSAGEGDVDAEGSVDADGDPDASPPPHSSRPSSSHTHGHQRTHSNPHSRPSSSHHSPHMSHPHPSSHHPSASSHHPHPLSSHPLSSSHTQHQSGKRPSPLDLDSSHGRRSFVLSAISHLRSTTYEPSDEMTVSALLAYLNAAVPADKYEDFDTGEVARILGGLRERGRVRLEGDLIW